MSVFILPQDQQAVRDQAIQLFKRMHEELTAKLPGDCEVLHIGATAIPNCLTKGDLDIVVRCNAADFDKADRVLADLYARNLGSVRSDDFSAFEDKTTSPESGVQLTVRGGSLDVFHVFVDTLLNDPLLVDRYNELKRSYSGQSMDAYRPAKDTFIHSILGR